MPSSFSVSRSNVVTAQNAQLQNGATGNGTTDDTTALQNAVNSSLFSYVPQGTYKITSPLSLSTIGQIVSGGGIADTNGHGTLLTQATSGAAGIEFITASGSQTGVGAGPLSLRLTSLSVAAANAGTGTGFILGASGEGAAYCTVQDVYLYNFLVGADYSYAGITRTNNLTIAGPGAATSGSIGVSINGTQANSQLWSGLSVAKCENGVLIASTPGGNVFFNGDFGVNGTHFKVTATGGDIVAIGGNHEGYTAHAYDFGSASSFSATLINPYFTLDGTQTTEPIVTGGNKVRYIGSAGQFGSGGSVMQFLGEGHVVLDAPNFSSTTINTKGVNISSAGTARKWTQGVFPAYPDNAVPSSAAGIFGGIILMVPRTAASGPANLIFFNQDASGTYFNDGLCNSAILLGANTFSGNQTYNGTLTYNSTFTGTGIGSITVNNNSAAALTLRNTGTEHALNITAAGGTTEVAYIDNVGTIVGARFYSPGTTSPGAFQTNAWILNTPASNTFGLLIGSTQVINATASSIVLGSGVLPATDPHVAGQLWSNSGIVTQSSG